MDLTSVPPPISSTPKPKVAVQWVREHYWLILVLVAVLVVVTIVIVILALKYTPQHTGVPTTVIKSNTTVHIDPTTKPTATPSGTPGAPSASSDKIASPSSLYMYTVPGQEKATVAVQETETGKLERAMASPAAVAALQFKGTKVIVSPVKQTVQTGVTVGLATASGEVVRMFGKLPRTTGCEVDLTRPIEIRAHAAPMPFDPEMQYRPDLRDHIKNNVKTCECTQCSYVFERIAQHPDLFHLYSADRAVQLVVFNGRLTGVCSSTPYNDVTRANDVEATTARVSDLYGTIFWVDAEGNLRLARDLVPQPHYDLFVCRLMDGTFGVCQGALMDSIAYAPAAAIKYVSANKALQMNATCSNPNLKGVLA